MALTDDERQVLIRLEQWHARTERCLDLLGQLGGTRADVDKVRRLYSELKHDLSSEYQRLRPGRAQLALSAAERAWYWPAIQSAATHRAPAVNTTPGPRWFDAVYLMHGDFSDPVHVLRRRERGEGTV